MSTLVIRGTLADVERKLQSIKRLITGRKNAGYPLWNKAELWKYSSASDSRVCIVCNGFDGKIYSGDVIKVQFPSVEYLGNYVALPRTHDNPDFPSHIQRRVGAPNGCGCTITLINPAEAFEAQLHEDKLRVI